MTARRADHPQENTMTSDYANHFEIGGNTDADDADISITCLRCPGWHEWLKVSTVEDGPGVVLADLNRRAEQHAASCPAQPAADHHARLAAGTEEARHECTSPAACWADPDCPVYSSRRAQP